MYMYIYVCIYIYGIRLLSSCLLHGLKSVQLSISTETGSYFRLIDSCITQLKAQGPSRTCNESKEEEEESMVSVSVAASLFLVAPRRALRGGISKVNF